MENGSPWPRISIVTPSFNQVEYIEETIRSVLLQGYPNLEYIIIDGGSTDGSLDIIRRYEPWLAYWVSEPDRGQSHALNKGFALSTGKIMAYLNSDDIYYPGALYNVAREYLGRGFDLLVGSLERSLIHPDSAMDTQRITPHDGNRVHLFPVFKNGRVEDFRCLQPSMFWSRNIWQTTGEFNQDLHFMMDREWCLRALAAGAVVRTSEEVFARYTLHPGSKSHDQSLQFSNEMTPIYLALSRQPQFRRFNCYLEALNYSLAHQKDACYAKSRHFKENNSHSLSSLYLLGAKILRRLRIPVTSLGNWGRARAAKARP